MIVGVLGNSSLFFFAEIKQNKWGGEKSRESLCFKRESEL